MEGLGYGEQFSLYLVLVHSKKKKGLNKFCPIPDFALHIYFAPAIYLWICEQ